MKKNLTIALLLPLLLVLTNVRLLKAEALPVNYYLAIKGGVSLGSYESGLNWSALQFIHQDKSNQSKLISASGASAGSINSLLTAITDCHRYPQNNDTLFDNIMRKSWDVGLLELLKRQKNESSLLSRAALREQVNKIIKVQLDKPATNDCDLLITMSVTKMKPYLHLLASQETISLQRFVVPFRVMAKRGESVKFYNAEIPVVASQVPGPYLQLMEKSQLDSEQTQPQPLTLDDVINLAFASSAFPMAFQPVTLQYCFANQLGKDQRCDNAVAKSALFTDGGLFDNSPVGVAKSIFDIKNNDEQKLQSLLIFINPDHYRPFYPNNVSDSPCDNGANKKLKSFATQSAETKPSKTNPSKTKPSKTQSADSDCVGLWEYATYLAESFNTATGEEYKKTLIELEQSGKNAALIVSTRHHNLLADFHAHFGALYSPLFRKHDYLVGLFDGAYLWYKIQCSQKNDDKLKSSSCIKQSMKAWVSRISKRPVKTIEDIYAGEKAFLEHLYNSEFGHSFALNKNQNIYIALNSAFADFSRVKTKKQDASFGGYLERLRVLLATDFKTIKLNDKQLTGLLYDTASTGAEGLRKLFDNLQYMQRASAYYDSDSEQKNMNAVISDVIDFAEPIASSYFSYVENGTWPLPVNSFLPNRTTHSLRYGLGVVEKTQKISFANRFHLAHQWSFDSDITYNIFSNRQNDHYWDISLGATYHKNGIAINTIGFGLEHAFKGKHVVRQTQNGIYLSLGMLNEIMLVKVSHRNAVSSLDYPTSNRSDSVLSLQFDVLKILDLIFE